MTRRTRCLTAGCGCVCHRATVRRSATLWIGGMDRIVREGLERGDTVEQIASRLTLTPGAVRWRIRRLDRSTRDGWYSPTEIRGLLGVSWRAVRDWVGRGWLRPRMHGRRWRRVSSAELERFVGTYGGLAFAVDGVTDPRLHALAEVAAAQHARRSG